MKISIVFESDNAAFDADPTTETARVLRGIADDIENTGRSGYCREIRDINGNAIGVAIFETTPEPEPAEPNIDDES